MPNWCMTYITINNEDRGELESFYEKIKDWTSHDYKENGFGHNWLGNIVGNSGIGTIDEGKETDLRCRGWIDYLEIGENQLLILTETAWIPMLQMWIKLLKNYLPNAELIYSAEEPGCEILATNDPCHINKYYIDAFGLEDVDSDLEADETDVVEVLQRILNETENNIDYLLKMLECSSFKEKMNIGKWEFIEIDNWD